MQNTKYFSPEFFKNQHTILLDLYTLIKYYDSFYTPSIFTLILLKFIQTKNPFTTS